jgi:AraC-like DNA-binding protein
MITNSLVQEIYYPALSVSDQNWGLTVTTAGYQSVPPHSIYPAGDHPPVYAFRYQNGRILDEYQLVYISKGKGFFSTGSIREMALTEGSLFMLFPGEWHTYRPESETGWNTFWIGFKGNTIDQMVASGFFSVKSPVIQMGYHEKLVGLFQEVLTFAREERPGCQQLLAGNVSCLLGQIQYQQRNEAITNDRIHLLIDKARMLMKENIMQNSSPETIAGQLNISYSWFRRFFRKYTGVSPGQYLTHLKMQYARQLLEQTSLPVQAIAEQLHFESPGYFSVYFKRQTGLNPLEYRKSKKQRSTDR